MSINLKPQISKSLFLYVDSLHACGDAGEHFVWDGAKHVAEHGDRQVVAEDDGLEL